MEEDGGGGGDGDGFGEGFEECGAAARGVRVWVMGGREAAFDGGGWRKVVATAAARDGAGERAAAEAVGGREGRHC